MQRYGRPSAWFILVSLYFVEIWNYQILSIEAERGIYTSVNQAIIISGSSFSPIGRVIIT